MSNNGFVEQKLNTKKLINESFNLYTGNFKLFIKISLFAFFIKEFVTLMEFSRSMINDPTILFYYKGVSSIISLIAIYFITRFTVVSFICITARLKDKNITMRSAYNDAFGIVWKYIGVVISLFIILFIPLLGCGLAYAYISSPVVKWLVIALFAVIVAYFNATYSFARLMPVTEKEMKPYFQSSKLLVKGDFGKILFLVSALSLVPSIPRILNITIFNNSNEFIPGQILIIAVIIDLVLLFIMPLINTIFVVLFYQLKSNKRIG